ncbi:hypothetical protein HELRODRAFT_164042 [Helobdella robusta]|uniref:Uncharacterized protein n=1 Tax=Helobdella robusta TaxID=6412 RepID=T1EUT4_HELRO|nr:hypothetical protein HELRODRAFT_164042 [Helobdella robusta]ESN94237.1 hypothetical protein HELRODRAFT_164042 [Helobdella robusta]
MRPRSGKEYTSVELRDQRSLDRLSTEANPTNNELLTNHSEEYLNSRSSNFDSKKNVSKLASLYNKEREIAYAAMTRGGDGSVKLEDDKALFANQLDAKITEHNSSFLSPSLSCNKTHTKEKSLSSISSNKTSFNASHNQTNCVDYITLDFETSSTQANKSNDNNKGMVKFDSKVDYACIDFAKTKAIKEASEEHSKIRGSCSLNAESNSLSDLDRTVFFSNNSTNFYVPISPELLNYVSSSSDHHQTMNAAVNKTKSKTFEKQRKSSLDLLDLKNSSSHHSNTLPHNSKRNLQ